MPAVGHQVRKRYSAFRQDWWELNTAAKKIAGIEHELTTNSGSSLKDLVQKMSLGFGEMQDSLAMNRLMTRSLASNERRIPMFECDAHGQQMWVNEAWIALTGLTTEQMQGWGWVTAIHEEDRARIVEQWENAIIQKRIFIETFRYQNVLTRESAEVRCRADLVLSAAGRPLGWVGAAIPVKKEMGT
ncbi:MAG TPA: PAS domain-containing protein [Gemmatimonadaceae bacterium]